MRAVHDGYRVLAGLFVLGVLVNFFLAGLGVFQSRSLFEFHSTVGLVLGLIAAVLAILAVVLAVAGELERSAALMAVILLGLMIVQYLLVELFATAVPALAALHPVNGLLVLAMGVLVLREQRMPFRAHRGSGTFGTG